MRRIGLTGGIGSGKTAASDELGRLGAVIIDADVLAREVVAPGTPGLAAIVERFGSGVLQPEAGDGERGLDRSALGAIVFDDSAARRDLEAIIHPAVRRRAAEIEADAPAEAVVVHVIPLLVETGQAESFDAVVVVDVDHETQVGRVRQRTGWSVEEVERRIVAQASREARLAAADIVIDNTGSVTELKESIARLWSRLDPLRTEK